MQNSRVQELQARIKDKNSRIKTLQERLSGRDRQIDTLRKQLAGEDGDSSGKTLSLADFIGDQSPEPPVKTPVFFLTGRAKSGTSWLMRILDAHPEVMCKGEGRIFGRGYTREIPGIENVNGMAHPGTLYGALMDSHALRAWIETSVWGRGSDIDGHIVSLTNLAIEHFLREPLLKSGKRIVGDKTPFTGTEVIREISEIRPDAKMIHIIRDGRDVAVSAMHHMWNNARQEGGIHDLTQEEYEKRNVYRKDPEWFKESGQSIFAGNHLYGTARNWSEVVGQAMKDGPAFLGKNYTEVRYEDLLQDPETQIARLFEFLEADSRPGVVARCIEKASFERRAKGRKRGEEDPTAFMRKGVAGDWKNVFTEEDKQKFKEAAGDSLVKLGYENSLTW